MRKVAKFAFTSDLPTPKQAEEAFDRVSQVVSDWLEDKGKVDGDGSMILYQDGREASLTRSQVASSQGCTENWTLSEPTGGGRFATSVTAAVSGEQIGFT